MGDLSWRIPLALTQVRSLQQSLAYQKAEFERVLYSFSCARQCNHIWSISTLSEQRLVRTHRSAQDVFQGHPMLVWTDAHETKLAIHDVGIVREVTEEPPP